MYLLRNPCHFFYYKLQPEPEPGAALAGLGSELGLEIYQARALESRAKAMASRPSWAVTSLFTTTREFGNWDEKDGDKQAQCRRSVILLHNIAVQIELRLKGVCRVLCSTGRIGGLFPSGTRSFPSPTSDSFHLPVSSPPQYERTEYFAGRS